MLPGILDVRDLAYRSIGEARRIDDFVAAFRLEPVASGPRHSFEAPRVLVLVVRGGDARPVAARHLWLAGCAHVVLVRDLRRGEDELSEADWRAVLPAGAGVDIVAWTDGDPRACEVALERAIRIAGELPDEPPARAEVPDVELPPGPWIDVDMDIPSLIATALSAGLDGTTLRTTTGDHELTALPPRIELDLERRSPYPLGRDPVHPVRWNGSRMRAGLGYRGGELGPLDHDYECGPAKKLWGYSNNHPFDAAMSPEADLAVVRFDHDVLVTPCLPVRWSAMRRGGAVVEVARFERDVERCVLFGRADDPAHFTDDLHDEDAREHAPAVMLAGRQRYAVDYTLDTYRLTPGDRIDLIGMSGTGFGVFDVDHQLVRTGTGELLGGWHRHATIIDDDTVWREDLVTGARRPIVPTDFRVCADPEVEAIARDAMREGRFDRAAQIHAEHPAATDGDARAIAVPGTRNILYIVRGRFRVI